MAPLLDAGGRMQGVVALVNDVTERKRIEALMREADEQALRGYQRLVERIAALGQAFGAARDLSTIFRALREFAEASVSCAGIFISLYNPRRDARTAVYAWGDGEEIDVSLLPPIPVTIEGPNSRAVRTGRIVITNDFPSRARGHPGVIIGPPGGRLPNSSLVVPMSVMGRIVGTIEVQSYDETAYHDNLRGCALVDRRRRRRYRAVQLLARLLERRGAAVTATSSSAEALTSLERSWPDVIISDIGMPGEDGYALIRRVRALAEERGRELPAVALTAYAGDNDRKRALLAGFQRHVPKPVELSELIATIASLTGRPNENL